MRRPRPRTAGGWLAAQAMFGLPVLHQSVCEGIACPGCGGVDGLVTIVMGELPDVPTERQSGVMVVLFEHDRADTGSVLLSLDAARQLVNQLATAVAATGGAVAQVTLLGQSFDAGADEENQALCTAFCSALTATQPAQASFLAPEPDDEDDGDEPADFDPFLDTELRPASPAATAGDFRDVVKDWLVTEIGKAGGGELMTRDGEVIVVPPTAEATPEQMAEALRASGLPIEWDGELYRNVDTGDAYDGADGEWVKRVYEPLSNAARISR